MDKDFKIIIMMEVKEIQSQMPRWHWEHPLRKRPFSKDRMDGKKINTRRLGSSLYYISDVEKKQGVFRPTVTPVAIVTELRFSCLHSESHFSCLFFFFNTVIFFYFPNTVFFFLLYSMETQLHIHVYILFSHIIRLHHK